MESKPKSWNAQECADFLQMELRTLYARMAAGTGPPAGWNGSRYVFIPAEVEAWTKEQAAEKAAAEATG